MNEIYQKFMLENFPQTMMDQWLKCLEFCTIMQKAFPKLTLKKGIVYSFENDDNPHPEWPRQYTHAWLETENGQIIDPTLLQFSLLGQLHYEQKNPEDIEDRCIGCGQFIKKRAMVCGRCPWSVEAMEKFS